MNIVIIGANRGIGLEFCRQYLKNEANHIFAVCRKTSSGLDNLAGDRLSIIQGVDVGDLKSYEALEGQLGSTKIDLILHNSGIMKPVSLASFKLESINEQFQINTLGPIHSTLSLLPLLNQGGKIAFLTSKMGSIQDNTSGGSYGYRISKCALNMFARSLSHDLREQGIAVALLHPGWVKTDMTGHNGLITVEESVSGLIKVIEEKVNLENSGIYIDYKFDQIPW